MASPNASHKARVRWRLLLWSILAFVLLAGGYLATQSNVPQTPDVNFTNQGAPQPPDTGSPQEETPELSAEPTGDEESIVAEQASEQPDDADTAAEPTETSAPLSIPIALPVSGAGLSLPPRRQDMALPPWADRLDLTANQPPLEQNEPETAPLLDAQTPGEAMPVVDVDDDALAAPPPALPPAAEPADEESSAAPSGVPPGFEDFAGALQGPDPAGVPPGFEAFLMQQTTAVDVFFGGRFIYSGLATFDPMSIEFDDPQALAESVPGLSDTTDVLAALSLPLPLNENLRCVVPQQTNCGVLYPEVAELIFDSSTYRADLFVNSGLLSLQTLEVQPYLGPSSAGFSVFQGISVASTGTDQSGTINSSIDVRTLVSFGETFARVTSNWTEDLGLQFDNFNLQRDWQGMRYQAGLISPAEDLRFAQSNSIIGISAGTTLDTREDLRLTSGNRFEIFLPLRARVSLFKDNRLITSAIYEAGNHEIDTSPLPGGSYNVELRIEDANGVRTETRFYTKSSRLPPQGSAQTQFSIGYLENATSDKLLDPSDEYVWRVSRNTRLNTTTALRLGATGNSDQQVGEVGLFATFPYLQFSLDGAVSSASETALSGEVTGTFGQFSYSARLRRVWSDSQLLFGQDRLIGFETEQTGLNLNFPLAGGSVGLSYRNNEQFGEQSETTSADFRFAGIDSPFGQITPSLQIGQQDGLGSVLFSLRLRENRGQWQFAQRTEYGATESSAGNWQHNLPIDGTVRWRSPDEWRNQLQTGLSLRRPESGSLNATGDLDLATDYGRMQLQTNHLSTESGSSTSWSVRSNTSLVYTGGTVAFGGRQQNQSAVLVDLRDVEIDGAYFAIMVDDSEAGLVNPGSATLVPLTPYDTYSVRLESRGLAFAAIDNRSEEITLYPGNAVKLDWTIEQINIVFGRLLDSDGNPVAGALLHGVEGLAVTDDSGFFQAELSTRAERLQAETLTNTCEFEIPDYQVSRSVGRLGTLYCELEAKQAR